MKISLTMPLIKSLSVELKPVTVDGGGKVVFESNPLAKDYIVWDTSQDAPPGFGVRVARKKTFVIRRKFNGKSIMASLGNVADYVGEKSPLSKARSDAAAIVLKMRETGKNPNADTYFWFGMVQLLVCLPLHVMLGKDAPRISSPHAVLEHSHSLREALRHPAFWKLAMAFAANMFIFSALSVHLIPLLKDFGHTAGLAVMMLSILITAATNSHELPPLNLVGCRHRFS